MPERSIKMSREKLRSYSKEFKAQIVKECMETNNYVIVAQKHDVPPTTVYTWFRRDKTRKKLITVNLSGLWRKNWQTQSSR
jgi:transposase-like protein